MKPHELSIRLGTVLSEEAQKCVNEGATKQEIGFAMLGMSLGFLLESGMSRDDIDTEFHIALEKISAIVSSPIAMESFLRSLTLLNKEKP